MAGDRGIGRRDFLSALPALALASPAAVLEGAGATPADSGRSDEHYWRAIADEFVREPGIVNLNSGGISPRLHRVEAAFDRALHASRAQPFYAWRSAHVERLEEVRAAVAVELGVSAEEVALTRNTTSGLAAVQNGLALERGDLLVTTSHAFPTMKDVWRQRAARVGCGVHEVEVPVPFHEARFLDAFAAAVDRGARAALVEHVVDITGQVLPLGALCDIADARGVPLVVDGAQAFAQIAIEVPLVRCAAYATSLHKWACAPVGTGALFVRSDWIERIEPLIAAPAASIGDVRKFEVDGAEMWMRHLAVPDALHFHRVVGPRRKAGRLVALRRRLEAHLSAIPGARILTDVAEGRAAGMLAFALEGVDARALRDHLWERHRVRVRGISQDGFEAVRVSPHLHVGFTEIDRLGELLAEVARRGLA